MVRDYFEEASKLIESNKNLTDFSESQPDELIIKAEEKLGVKFPKSYIKFLNTYGAGGICSQEFYGLFKEDFNVPAYNDVVWSNLQLRKLGMLKHLIVIYSLGEGTEYAIDTSKFDNCGECPIVAVPVQYEKGMKLEVLANSFEQFFYNIIKTAIERHKNSTTT